MIEWQWCSYEELTRDTLFEIIKVRQEVFIVEQNCAYQDVDDLDRFSWHLIGWRKDSAGEKLVAYLRVVFPGKKYLEPAIGRVVTAPSVRGTGLGYELTQEAISRVRQIYPNTDIRISAQQYLEGFYSKFGFEKVGNPYDEDGIRHIEMLRKKD